MVKTPATLAFATAWLATVCVAMLVLAATAMAAPSAPGGLGSNPKSPTNAAQATFSWQGSLPDPLGVLPVRYQGGLGPAGGGAPAVVSDYGSPSSGPVTLPAGDGPIRFFVRAVQDPVLGGELLASDYSSILITVDRTAPVVTVALSPAQPNGLNGWYTGQNGGLTIVPTCPDASTITGCGQITWTQQRAVPAGVAVNVKDAAGNSATGNSPAFKYDAIAPTPPGLLSPGPNAKLVAEPTYIWTWDRRREDGTSGTDHYDVEYRVGNGGSYSSTLLARVACPASCAITTVSTLRNVLPAPLPINEDIWWRVRTFDFAGNSSLTKKARKLRIDPLAPPAPTITGGPSGSTNVAAPTFSWNGDQPSFTWDVTAAGEDAPAQSGTGPATQVALKPLSDGAYTFRVSQVSPFSVVSAEATRSLEVDTVAPPAPIITRRPTFPTVGPAVFSWSTEAGSFGRWSVLGGGGATLRGPSDAPTGNVTLTGLANGAFDFRLVAIDPAGNVSQNISDPFAITGAATTGRPAPSKNRLLPKLNASRLRPRAGRVLPTRRPVLSWIRGPKGTTLYNVQLFRVVKKGAAGQQTVKKVISSFPHGMQYRTSKKMTPGACYIWRVWPYLRTRFADKPLGISNFCIASAKVLRARAAKGRRSRR